MEQRFYVDPVLYEGRPVELVVEQLMTRSKSREVDESWI